MVVALRRTATVLPGSRIEVTAPELPEGAVVELIVLRDLLGAPSAAPSAPSVVDYIESLPRDRHTSAEWDGIMHELAEDKLSWDR
ncbi:MAG: hypothetical protein NT029_11390 [Armatimonadetes bacterium]|nr:hypothetical protein [Armatimonadota bacterium]